MHPFLFCQMARRFLLTANLFITGLAPRRIRQLKGGAVARLSDNKKVCAHWQGIDQKRKKGRIHGQTVEAVALEATASTLVIHMLQMSHESASYWGNAITTITSNAVRESSLVGTSKVPSPTRVRK